MDQLKIPATVAALLICATLGYKALLRPLEIQERAQRDYAKRNQFLKVFPLFQGMIFKPWYPKYLRVMGIWLWLFSLLFALILYLELTAR